jgi:hypothetical protein
MRSVEAIRRKLRYLTVGVGDAGATARERANAEALKSRLEHRLREAGVPAGDWTDNAFRVGQWAQKMSNSSSPASPTGGWIDNAFLLGKSVRRGYKTWSSEWMPRHP